MRSKQFYTVHCFLLIVAMIAEHSSGLSSMDPKSTGLQILKQRKADARMSRIAALLSEDGALSLANQKELASLMNTDTYDSNTFSESHRLFKATHNDVFATLGIIMIMINDTALLPDCILTNVCSHVKVVGFCSFRSWILMH